MELNAILNKWEIEDNIVMKLKQKQKVYQNTMTINLTVLVWTNNDEILLKLVTGFYKIWKG